jgi:hypothetical protein
VLAFVILFIRRNLPESPRWLLTHGFLGIDAENKSLETVARPLTEVGSGGSAP